DLRATDKTLPPVRHEVGPCIAPIAQRRCPFLCTTHVERFLTHFNDGAVHQASNDRRHFARFDSDHCFVEQPQSCRTVASANPGLTLTQSAKRREIGVLKSCSTISRATGNLECK